LTASGFNIDAWKKKSSTSRSLNDIPADDRVIVGGAVGGKGSGSSNFTSYILVFCALAVAVSSIHAVLSKPVVSGTTLKYGTIKYKCGVLSFVPDVAKDVVKTLLEPFQADIQSNPDSIWNCQYEKMTVSEEDGVTIVNEDGATIASLPNFGNTDCASIKSNKKKNQCVEGLQFGDDFTLKMGTARMNSATLYGKKSLSPWPFAESPKGLSVSKRRAPSSSK
ncbi:MAG: hypothetical protein SGARI_007891, partial [Bacillariaceae sp.]